MKKLLVVLFVELVSIALFAHRSIAQETESQNGKLFFEFSGYYGGVWGAEEIVGYVMEYNEVYNTKTYYDDYNFRFKPIKLSLPMNANFGGAVYFKKGLYTFGVSGSVFKLKDALSGVITNKPYAVRGDEVIWDYTWLKYWGANLFPLYNDLEPSKESPISYSAEQKMMLWFVDAFLEKESSFIEGLSSYFGVRFAKPEYFLSLGMIQHAHISDYYGWMFDNKVKIESPAKAEYTLLAGPIVGLGFSRKYESFFVRQGVLVGPMKERFEFFDVDDITWIRLRDGYKEMEYYDGYVNFEKKETAVVPITSFGAKVRYPIGKWIVFGFSLSDDIYWAMKIYPSFQQPWMLSRAGGFEGKTRERTLNFYQLNVHFTIVF